MAKLGNLEPGYIDFSSWLFFFILTSGEFDWKANGYYESSLLLLQTYLHFAQLEKDVEWM